MKLDFEQISYSNVRKECFDNKKRSSLYLLFNYSYYTKDQKFYLEYNMTCFFCFYFAFGYIITWVGLIILLIVVIIIMLNEKYKIKEDLIATLLKKKNFMPLSQFLGFSHFCFCLESILQWMVNEILFVLSHIFVLWLIIFIGCFM